MNACFQFFVANIVSLLQDTLHKNLNHVSVVLLISVLDKIMVEKYKNQAILDAGVEGGYYLVVGACTGLGIFQ